MPIRNDAVEEAFPINVTNMIDIMLVLVIFFLVATRFAQEERDSQVQLPGTAAIRPISAPTQDFIINIQQDGSIHVEGNTMQGKDLATMLHHIAVDEPQRNILIRADERSTMKYFASVVALCLQQGISQTRIGYVDKSEAPSH